MTLPDPRIAALEAHFCTVASTQMQDVPLLNPALRVEAVGFRAIDSGCLGVLISPWFMNLVWLRSVEEGVAAPDSLADSLVLALPSGEYDCWRNHAPTVGAFYTCSLFSPVLEFADHASAVLTARHVMLTVLDEQAHNPVIPPSQTQVSRRDFLRGKFS
jgi:[NiFe] hydrogenase assembly HybE family chaperone